MYCYVRAHEGESSVFTNFIDLAELCHLRALVDTAAIEGANARKIRILARELEISIIRLF